MEAGESHQPPHHHYGIINVEGKWGQMSPNSLVGAWYTGANKQTNCAVCKGMKNTFSTNLPFSRLFAAMRSIPAAQLFLWCCNSPTVQVLYRFLFRTRWVIPLLIPVGGVVELSAPRSLERELKLSALQHLHLEQTTGSVLFKDVYLSWCKNLKLLSDLVSEELIHSYAYL